MAELTINQLIKIILGLVVVVAVVGGIYLIFKNSIIDFIKGLGGNETSNLVLSFLR